MKNLIFLSFLACSTSFAGITAQMTAQPYPAGGSHHDKIFVTSDHDAVIINDGAMPVTFTITYKVCEDNDCYSLARTNAVVGPYNTWRDHARIQTSKKYRSQGLYKSYAVTQIDSSVIQQKSEAWGRVTVG